MSNKKKLPPIVYIGAALAVATGTYTILQVVKSPDTTQSSTKSYGNSANQIKILGDTFSGYSTLRSDDFAGKVTKANLGIAYEDEFDQARRAKRLGSDADIIVTTLDQFLVNKPQGKIVGLIDKTVGADAVVLNTSKFPALRGINDLRKVTLGRKIKLKLVYSSGTPSEYLAKMLDIRFEGFKLADFEIIETADASEAYKLLQTDPDVAVAVLWEPYVSKAKQDGNTVSLSSRDVPDSIVDVIVASNNMIQKKPEELKKFLTTYYQHNDSLVRNTSQLKAQIGEDGKLNSTDSANVAKGIEFFPSIKVDKWMTGGILAQRIEATSALLTMTGASVDTNQSNDLFTADFIQDAVNSSKRVMSIISATDPQMAKILSGEVSSANAAINSKQVQSSENVGNIAAQGSVDFATGSAQLTSEGQQTLDRLAKTIADFSPATTALNIVGHTSKTGDAQSNQVLSQQRADVVARYLKSKGARLAIASQGKGFSELLSGVSPTDAKNQRTEIQLKRIGG
jgi:OmpA-OmpF porin, OOP family